MFSKRCSLKTFFIPLAPRHFRRNFTNNSLNKMTVDWTSNFHNCVNFGGEFSDWVNHYMINILKN